VTILASDLTAKRFGLLHEAVPQANVIGVLRESRADPFSVQEAEAAARQVGVSTRVMTADSEDEIEAAFVTFAAEGVGALFVASSFLFVSVRDRVVALLHATGFRRFMTCANFPMLEV
jgi:putative tryptophan/tyrosine transport system substrate-binding protein